MTVRSSVSLEAAGRCIEVLIVIALLQATTLATADNAGSAPQSDEILGMSTGVAILVLVLVSFVVIACLLCVLHRQVQIMKASRRRTNLMELRRARDAERQSDDDDEDDEALLSSSSGPGVDTSSYKSPAALLSGALIGAEISVSAHPDIASQHEGNLDSDASPLLQHASLTKAHAVDPDGGGGDGGRCDVEEGTDAHSVHHSVRKVGSWLNRSAQLLPPVGSPQFITLRASSFVGLPAAPLLPPAAAPDDANTAIVYVRTNSRQRRSNTMPTRVPPTSVGGVISDPFNDIPLVSMQETYPKANKASLTVGGASGRSIRRSVSVDSQTSDPFS